MEDMGACCGIQSAKTDDSNGVSVKLVVIENFEQTTLTNEQENFGSEAKDPVNLNGQENIAPDDQSQVVSNNQKNDEDIIISDGQENCVPHDPVNVVSSIRDNVSCDQYSVIQSDESSTQEKIFDGDCSGRNSEVAKNGNDQTPVEGQDDDIVNKSPIRGQEEKDSNEENVADVQNLSIGTEKIKVNEEPVNDVELKTREAHLPQVDCSNLPSSQVTTANQKDQVTVELPSGGKEGGEVCPKDPAVNGPLNDVENEATVVDPLSTAELQGREQTDCCQSDAGVKDARAGSEGSHLDEANSSAGGAVKLEHDANVEAAKEGNLKQNRRIEEKYQGMGNCFSGQKGEHRTKDKHRTTKWETNCEDNALNNSSFKDSGKNKFDLKLLPVRPDGSHVVCVQYGKYNPGTVPKQYPQYLKHDCWDNDHVKMPFSQKSEFPVTNTSGARVVRSR